MASGLLVASVLWMVCSIVVVKSAILLNEAGGSGSPAKCPSRWFYLESRCFIFFDTPKTFLDAETMCIDLGGNLASIHTPNQNRYVSNLAKTVLGDPMPIWIGGHDSIVESRWFWTDGTKWNYEHWDAKEPNNARGYEHCLVTNYDGSRWNDLSCATPQAFVCAKRI